MAVLHTTVPYLWRRHFGILRPVLGLLGVALYVGQPVGGGHWPLAVCALYTVYALALLLRTSVAGNVYALPTLIFDLSFFLVCAFHGGEQGLWLSTLSYFFLITFATLLYEWPLVAAVVIVICAFFSFLRPMPMHSMWSTTLFTGVFAVLMGMEKKSLANKLSAALKRSVIARSEAETAREKERQRIAADFHDGPLQSFISFQMRLEVIRKMLARDTEAGLRELVQLQDLGRAQVTELRAFVRNMQPAEVKPSNLQGAIREAVEHFERDSGITANFVCGDLSMVEEDTATELLQLVQEALNNVRKHSKASLVSIILEWTTDGVEIGIDDDGSGFAFSGTYSLDELEMLRLGPRSIKRRVRTLGGDLTLQSRPTQGASLQIRIPA